MSVQGRIGDLGRRERVGGAGLPGARARRDVRARVAEDDGGDRQGASATTARSPPPRASLPCATARTRRSPTTAASSPSPSSTTGSTGSATRCSRKGSGPGDAVGVMCRNHRQLLIAAFGTARAGLSLVLAQHRRSRPASAPRSPSARASRLLIHDAEFADAVAEHRRPAARWSARSTTRRPTSSTALLERCQTRAPAAAGRPGPDRAAHQRHDRDAEGSRPARAEGLHRRGSGARADADAARARRPSSALPSSTAPAC